MRFCNWILEGSNEKPNFAAYVLWSDETAFSREGVINMHNKHYWALAHLHVVHKRKFQEL
jgi:hypothetical protein